MSGLNVQQKIFTFATTFGVTYVLLDLNRNVLRATFKFLNAAFDEKDGEEIRQRKIEKEVRRGIGEILRRREEVEEEEEETEKRHYYLF